MSLEEVLTDIWNRLNIRADFLSSGSTSTETRDTFILEALEVEQAKSILECARGAISRGDRDAEIESLPPHLQRLLSDAALRIILDESVPSEEQDVEAVLEVLYRPSDLGVDSLPRSLSETTKMYLELRIRTVLAEKRLAWIDQQAEDPFHAGKRIETIHRRMAYLEPDTETAVMSMILPFFLSRADVREPEAEDELLIALALWVLSESEIPDEEKVTGTIPIFLRSLSRTTMDHLFETTARMKNEDLFLPPYHSFRRRPEISQINAIVDLCVAAQRLCLS